MKTIKMFAMTAPMVLMAMAFAGVSPAMAESTTLCDQDSGSSLCPEGHAITHVHEATLTGHKAIVLTTAGNVECDVLFLGDTVTELGAPLSIKGNYTYANCGNCIVIETGGPALIQILKLGHETADETLEDLVTVNCNGSPFIKCSYLGEGLLGTVKGPLLSTETNGEMSIQGQVLKRHGGALCPTMNVLDLVLTPLIATYITS